MWVKAKTKRQISAATENIEISQSVQEGSKWLAFHEPDINAKLPWRVNHKFLNIRLTEEEFREMFEEI